MKNPRVSLIAVLLPLAIICCSDTTFVFQVQDSVSGKWVWDATVRLQDRTLVSYYQSDAGPVPQKISHLKPGRWTAEFSAPGYETVKLPVTLRRGRNRLINPVRMTGLEIPGLQAFRNFESFDRGDLLVQLRPVDAAGRAILNHPCIDLWIGCVVFEHVDGPHRARGDVLFRGVLGWQWNALPESLFRYSARIPSSRIEDRPSSSRVIDYLVVVPRPEGLSREELVRLMEAVWKIPVLSSGASVLSPSLAAALDAQKDKLRYFFSTSWDVKARAQ